MSKRHLTTLEAFKLIDNLQAVSRNIDDAARRLGLPPVDDLGAAFEQALQIQEPVVAVIIKLMAQSSQFEPTEWSIEPLYRNESGEFEMDDAEWAVADQWAGVYTLAPSGFYESMIIAE